MDTVKLNHFIKICEKDCNLSKAAAELYISQPALSQSIASLEEELKTQLFERKKGRLHLTEKGEEALKYSKSLIALEKEFKDKLSESNPELSVFSIEPNLTFVLLSGFLQTNPKLKFTHEYDTEILDYSDKVYNSNFDLYITDKPFRDKEFDNLFILNDCEYAYVPEDSRFYGQQSAYLEDFAGETFVRSGNYTGNGYPFRISTYLTNLIEKKSEKYQVLYFDQGITTQIFLSNKQMDEANKYYRFLPTLTLYTMYRYGSYLQDRKRLVKLKNEEMTIRYYLTYRKKHSETTEALLCWIRDNYTEIFAL